MPAYSAQFCPSCGRQLEDAARPCAFCAGVPSVPAAAPAAPPVAAERDPDWPYGKPRTGLYPVRAAVLVCAVALLSFDDRGRLFLTALALSQPQQLVYLLGFVIAGRIWHQVPLGFSFGFSPVLLVLRAGACLILIGTVPLGGSVHWKQEPTADKASPGPAPWRSIRRSADATQIPFDQLHPFVRLCVMLSGPLFALLLALAVLGMPAIDSFLRAFEQFAGALFRSREENMALFRPFLARIEAGDYAYAIGTFATKCAAANLLPLGITVGGMALEVLWEWVRGRRVKQGWSATIQYVGLIVSLVYACVICRALWEVVYHWNH